MALDTAASEFQCPCCGFIVFSGPPGTYEICPVCGWEDDHVQLRYPTMAGGANGESLQAAQQHALKEVPLQVRAHLGHVRDPAWRPLEQADLTSPKPPQSGQEYFGAALAESPSYYWLTSPSGS